MSLKNQSVSFPTIKDFYFNNAKLGIHSKSFSTKYLKLYVQQSNKNRIYSQISFNLEYGFVINVPVKVKYFITGKNVRL